MHCQSNDPLSFFPSKVVRTRYFSNKKFYREPKEIIVKRDQILGSNNDVKR